MAIDKTLADIKEAIKKFIEEGKTEEEQQKRFAQVSAILEKLKTIKDLSATERAVELGKIRLELHGIGIEEPKITELYDNNEDHTEDLTKAMSELLQEETDRLKKAAEDEEERKRITATDEAEAKKLKDDRLKARENFIRNYNAISKQISVVQQRIFIGSQKLDALMLRKNEIVLNIELYTKKVSELTKVKEKLKAKIDLERPILEDEVFTLDAKISESKTKESFLESEIRLAGSEVEDISVSIADLEEKGKLDKSGKIDYAQAILDKKSELELKQKEISDKRNLLKAAQEETAKIELSKQKKLDVIKKGEDSLILIEGKIKTASDALTANQLDERGNNIDIQNVTFHLEEDKKEAVVLEGKREVILKDRVDEIKMVHANDPEAGKMSMEAEIETLKNKNTKMVQELELDREALTAREDIIQKNTKLLEENKRKLEAENSKPEAEKNEGEIASLTVDIEIGEKTLKSPQAEQAALVQKIANTEKEYAANMEKIKEMQGNLPEPLLSDEKKADLKALETEAAQLQKELDAKQQEIDTKEEEVSKKVAEITTLVGDGAEIGAKTEAEQQKIDNLNAELATLQGELSALVQEKTPLTAKLAENTKKAEGIKENSSTPSIVIDTGKNASISIPTGTSTGPNATGKTTNVTSNAAASNTTSVITATPQNTTTSVDAGVLRPEEKEMEKKWDKLGLPPDLSSSDDAVKNFWLMLFAMLTDVLAKTLAQDRKRVKALWNYAGSQLELRAANKSGDADRIKMAESRAKKASQDFREAFGLPPDEKITKFQMIRAVGSIIPLLSSSTYVQRYGLVDVKSKNNNQNDEKNDNSAALQQPGNATQNNPTVTTNSNQNSATSSATPPTVTTNSNQNSATSSATPPTVTTNSASTSVTPPVTANQSSGQPPTQNTATQANAQAATTLRQVTPPPFTPPPPTAPTGNAVNSVTSQAGSAVTSGNLSDRLSTSQEALGSQQKSGPDNKDNASSKMMVSSTAGIEVVNMNNLTKLAKEQAAASKEENKENVNPDVNLKTEGRERSSSMTGRK